MNNKEVQRNIRLHFQYSFQVAVHKLPKCTEGTRTAKKKKHKINDTDNKLSEI